MPTMLQVCTVVLLICSWTLIGELGFRIWHSKVLHNCKNKKERSMIDTKPMLCKNRFRFSGILGLMVGIIYK
jgi:hypothetical protein